MQSLKGLILEVVLNDFSTVAKDEFVFLFTSDAELELFGYVSKVMD